VEDQKKDGWDGSQWGGQKGFLGKLKKKDQTLRREKIPVLMREKRIDRQQKLEKKKKILLMN